MASCRYTPQQLERKRKALEKKHNEPYRILRASNGECAILPVSYIESVNRRKLP